MRQKNQPRKQPIPFDTYVNKTNTCWLWTGNVSRGYGHYSQHGDKIYAHRFSFIRAGKIIPKGMSLHHICEVKLCVNPDHLEPISKYQHYKTYHEGIGGVSINRNKTHCVRGHEFTEKNTYHYGSSRKCRRCGRENRRKYVKSKGELNDKS